MSKKLYFRSFVLFCALVLMLAGPALRPVSAASSEATAVQSTMSDDDFGEFDDEYVEVSDPLEGFNRAMFTFNDRLHRWVLEPTARAYTKVTPSMFRTGVSNFFNNLMEPARMLNCFLQGRFADGRDVLMRFLLNTTVGVVGIMDPAGYDKMPDHDVRFASTLKTYGSGSGPYLVLPFYGPSDVRGMFGLVGDTLATPLFWVLKDNTGAAIGVQGGNAVNKTSFRLGEYEKLLSGTLDPYVAIRDAYQQHQQLQFEQ
jgi:phospholipid-binding lipoprotein MlaA